MTIKTNDLRVLQKLVGTGIVLTIGFFFYCYFQYSLNIPWFDDIENIPYFLANWLEAESFQEKWHALLRPNNEHRVIFARSIVLIQYYLTGSLQFQLLGFIGNLSIVVICILIGLNYHKQGGKWYHLLPVVLLLFNLQSYAGIYMTIMSLQYQVVIMLSMIAFYLLSTNKSYAFPLALLVAYIDTFSMGNGMLVWPAGLLMLFFLREWRKATIWTVLGGIAIFLYFYGFDFVQGNDRAIDYLKQYPVRTFISFFTMLGGDFDIILTTNFSKRMFVPTVAGFFIVLVLLIWTLSLLKNNKRIFSFLPTQHLQLSYSTTEHIRTNAFWFASIAYTIGGILLVVLLRTRFDYQLVLWSTYKMYPAVITSIVYLIILQNISSKYRIPSIMIGSLLATITCLFSYLNFLPEVKATSRIRKAFAYNQQQNGIGLGAEKNGAFDSMVQETFKRSSRLGFYELPTPFIHADEQRLPLVTTNESVLSSLLEQKDNSFVIEIPSLTPQDDAYIFFQSNEYRYLFAVNKVTNKANCPLATIRKGTYDIAVWKVTPQGSTLHPIEQKVHIEL